MKRYSKTTRKNQREVVLLKGKSCVWGKCTFCDYIKDNCDDEIKCHALNRKILKKVKGTYGALEVINSGNVFELPLKTLQYIKLVVAKKKIQLLYFECHYLYKDRLQEIRDFFQIPIIFKLGIETFDEKFRNEVLHKGIIYNNLEEIKQNFSSVCLLVGIKGQTKEMIENDIKILLENFEYGCINLYNNNSTEIKQDDELIEWFKEKYYMLEEYPKIDVLYSINDFDVGKIKKKDQIYLIVKSAVIAAIYVVFCFIFPSYQDIQFRFSELLVLLVFFKKEYGLAIVIGCFIANLYSPFGIYDIIFGTLASVLTILCIIKSKHLLVATLFPTLFCFIVGLEIHFIEAQPLIVSTLSVMAGEFIVVTVIGYPLFMKLGKNKNFLKLIQSEKEFDGKRWIRKKTKDSEIPLK